MIRILIAVRSEVLSEALSCTLSKHQIYTCCSGHDAIEQINLIHPHVLLIDLSLPFIGGISVLENSAYRPPVIIGLTNLLSDRIISQARRAGFHFLALIPIDLEQIFLLVENSIKKAFPSLGV